MEPCISYVTHNGGRGMSGLLLGELKNQHVFWVQAVIYLGWSSWFKLIVSNSLRSASTQEFALFIGHFLHTSFAFHAEFWKTWHKTRVWQDGCMSERRKNSQQFWNFLEYFRLVRHPSDSYISLCFSSLVLLPHFLNFRTLFVFKKMSLFVIMFQLSFELLLTLFVSIHTHMGEFLAKRDEIFQKRRSGLQSPKRRRGDPNAEFQRDVIYDWPATTLHDGVKSPGKGDTWRIYRVNFPSSWAREFLIFAKVFIFYYYHLQFTVLVHEIKNLRGKLYCFMWKWSKSWTF